MDTMNLKKYRSKIRGMKLLKLTSTLLLLLLGIGNSYAQGDFCSPGKGSFKAGERLTFKVFYNMGFIWLHAGNAEFSTRAEELGNHKVLHIRGDGRTVKSYEWFYKVNDQYETYLDQETMLPLRFVRNVNEGDMSFRHDVTFVRNQQKAVSAGKEYPVPQCTQDVLSAIYFARNINYDNFHPGDRIPFDMFLDDKVYSLYIKYLGKETIETKMGRFHAIKIAPLLIEGTIFSGGEKMVVWVSDDKNHLPLRVDSPIIIGSIKVDLMAYENLQNPFDAMIKRFQG